MKNIDKDALVQILRRFADDPDEVLVERDKIVCRINDENHELTLSYDNDGGLLCEEPGYHRMKVRAWIEKRLARLPELAQQILKVAKEDEYFIPVPSEFDSLNRGGAKETVEKTTEALFDRLKNGGDWSTEVFYLLSDAGEGKTWIMLRLAHLVAKAYLNGDVHFLFLPIGLDGKPFLRFDAVVIGVLTENYRFRRFYYAALLELAKAGFLVLGLDGFEEMTVEGKENAVISSLGDLLQQHQSSGALVISARKAFYQYALKDQAPLMDTIRDLQVDFFAYHLRPWEGREFLSLMSKFEFPPEDADRLYRRLSSKLGSDHPILVRPVLARKLVELMNDSRRKADDCERIVDEFAPDENSQKILQKFIELLLRREASEKWLRPGTQNGALQQLLSWMEHAAMLEEIAEEMWTSSVECLGQDVLQSITQLFCESVGKSPAETNECMEKILHHAMLTKSGDAYFFCHDAFRRFFLGSRIAHAILRGEGVRNDLLSRGVLSDETIDAIVFALANSGKTFVELKDEIDAVRKGQSRNTPINQNSADILSGLWKQLRPAEVQFDNLVFYSSATDKVPFENVTFRQCFFENISVPAGTAFNGVRFLECTLCELSLPAKANNRVLATFDEGSLPSKLVVLGADTSENEEFYDPSEILSQLGNRGCSVPLPESDGRSPERQDPHDAKLFHAFEKLVRLFMRTTGVSGSVLKMRMNKQWREWEDDFIPAFIKQGLMSEETWHGGGSDIRYVLKVPVARYERARMECHGKFDEFCQLMKQAR